MDRKWKSGASATPPASSDNASDGYATAGTPGTGVAATKPGPYMWHMLVEELLACVAAGGLTPDKTVLTQLRDAVMPKEQTTTSTGTQNDFAATSARRLLLRCNNASALTLTGFAAGQAGDRIEVVSVAAGAVTIKNQDGGSAATKRVITPWGGDVVLVAGSGSCAFAYDGTTQRWRLTGSEMEIGSWSPTIAGSGGTSGQTYTTQVGRYIKWGRHVIAWGQAVLSAKGTITADVVIGGLPFPSYGSGAYASGVVGYFANLLTNWINLTLRIQAGSSIAIVYGRASAGTTMANLAAADIANTTDVSFTVVYETAN